MRRRMTLLVAATTSAVVVSFVVPLCPSTRVTSTAGGNSAAKLPGPSSSRW